jgi:transposase
LQATKSQTKTADLLRISFDQVHRIMQRAVSIGLSRRDPDERYYYLSFDEKAVKKGQEYITVLSDESSGTVPDVIAGRTGDSVEELCQTALSEAQRDAVKTVCTDMWKPYVKGAKDRLTNALHCHDPFHCAGYLNKAADKVRKREVKQHEDLRKTK